MNKIIMYLIFVMSLLITIPLAFAVQYSEEQGIGFGSSVGYSSLSNAEDCWALFFQPNRTYTLGKFDLFFTLDYGAWNGSIWSNETASAYRPKDHLFTFETGQNIVSGVINFSSETGYEVLLGEDYYLVACRDVTGSNTMIKASSGVGRWAESDDGGDTWKNLFSKATDYIAYSIDEITDSINVNWNNQNPLNNSVNELITLEYFYNFTGENLLIANCSIYINDSLEETNNNLDVNITHSFNITRGYPLEENITSFVDCIGDNGLYDNSTLKYVYWNLPIDTTNPIITFNFPFDDNTSEIKFNTPNNIRLEFDDLNLFAYTVRVVNNISDEVYNFNMTGITTNQEILLESITANISGLWIINATVTDDHTALFIKDYDYKVVNNKIDFKFEKLENRELLDDNISITYISDYDLMKTTVKKEDDRYTFEYDVRLDANKFVNEVTHKFKVECEDIVLRDSSNYTAHFVCPITKNWIDFESLDVIDWTVKYINQNSYYVYLTMKPTENLSFSSIGGLNEITEYVTFIVLEEDSLSLFNFDFNNTAHVLFLMVLIILYLGVMAIGMFFRNIGFSSLGFFIGIVIGIVLGSVSIFLSLVLLFINVVIYYNIAKK